VICSSEVYGSSKPFKMKAYCSLKMSETDYPVSGVIDITRIKSTTGYISRFQVHNYPRCFKPIEETESLYQGTMKIIKRNTQKQSLNMKSVKKLTTLLYSIRLKRLQSYMKLWILALMN